MNHPRRITFKATQGKNLKSGKVTLPVWFQSQKAVHLFTNTKKKHLKLVQYLSIEFASGKLLIDRFDITLHSNGRVNGEKHFLCIKWPVQKAVRI